jgi:YD repeat-containing protein
MFDNEPYEHITFHHDDKGNVLEEAKFDEEGNLLEKQVNEYDDKGNVIRQQLFEGEELSQEVVLEYNESSLCTREVSSKGPEGQKEVTTYTYNEQGKKVRSETTDQKGNLMGYVTVEYDDKGNAYRYTSETLGFYPSKMVNQIVYDDEGRALESEYYDVLHGYMLSKESLSYDEEGNIKQQDIFEINPQQEMKKTHYSLQLVYEYFPEEEQVENN